MSKKYNIDELFRRGAGKHHFQPSDADREAAMKTLEAQTAKGGLKQWTLGLLVFLVVGGGIAAFALANQHQFLTSAPSHFSQDAWSSPMTARQETNTRLAVHPPATAENENADPSVVDKPSEGNSSPSPTPSSSGEAITTTRQPVTVISDNNQPSTNQANVQRQGGSLSKLTSDQSDVAIGAEAHAEMAENATDNEAAGSTLREGFSVNYNGLYQPLQPFDTIQMKVFNDYNPVPDTNLERIFDIRGKWLQWSVSGGFLASTNFTAQEVTAIAEWTFHPSWSLSTGAGYWWRPFDELTYTTHGTEYSFGRKNLNVKWEPLHVHYIKMPLVLRYKLSTRHQLKGGLETNFLINTYSRLTTTTQPGSGEAQQTVESDWGYNDGIKSFNINYLAGYEYRISEFWSVGATLRFGYGRLTKAHFFENDQLTNANAAIQLRYFLW